MKLRVLVVGSLAVLAACVGDSVEGGGPTEPQLDGGGGSSSSGASTSSGGGDASADLVLSADPLTVVAGQPSSLRLRVVSGSGPAKLRVSNVPVGMTAPPPIDVAAGATGVDIPIDTLAAMKHGVYSLQIAADAPLTTTLAAPVIVRGGSGSPDTGFGVGGGYRSATPVSAGALATLPDDRIVIAQGSSPFVVNMLDASGALSAVGTQLNGVQPQVGALEAYGMSDSKFMIRNSDYATSFFNAAASYEAKTVGTAAYRYASFTDAIIALRLDGSEYVLQRYAGAQPDPVFGVEGKLVIPAGADAQPPFGIVTTDSGRFWVVGNVAAFGADFNVWHAKGTTVSAAIPLYNVPLVMAPFGDDLAYRTDFDTESSIERVRVDPNATDGWASIPLRRGQPVRSMVSFHGQRLYLLTQELTPEPVMVSTIQAFGADGQLVPTFGVNGVLTVDGIMGARLALDARGRLVVWGEEQVGSANHFAVRRFWD